VSDEQVNLALLEIQQPDRATGLLPIALGDDLRRNSPAEVIQMDETSQVQRGDGHIVQIMMAQLPRAPYGSLTYTMLTDLNVNGEGAAVLSSNRLAGLIMSYDRNTRVGWVVPYPVISRFLAMADTSPYIGFASAGFSWAPLVDPVKRRYLGVNGNDAGISVQSYTPAPGADTNALKAGDVILAWDGHPIDNLGFYNDPIFGRMDLSWLIKGHHKPGDSIDIKIIRNRAEQTVTLPLHRKTDSENLVPDDTTGQPVEYLLHGGFLIRELSGRYLQSRGADWRRTADTRLVNIYITRRMAPASPGQRIVILSNVLPDPINDGFQNLRDQIITHVNGQAVSSMKDVFRIHDADGGVQRITLKSSGVDVVIDANTVEEANKRLLSTYGIPRLRYVRPESGDGTRPLEGRP
jgi:S1-C subfamily serine protease